MMNGQLSGAVNFLGTLKRSERELFGTITGKKLKRNDLRLNKNRHGADEGDDIRNALADIRSVFRWLMSYSAVARNKK